MSSSVRVLTRRSFLQAAAVAAGSLSLGASLPVLAEKKALHIGVLLPEAPRYADLSTSLFQGLALGFAGTNSAFSLQPLWYDGQSVNATSRLQELGSQVDLLIAAATSTMVASIHEYLQANDLSLVLVNTGANVVRAHHTTPHIFHASLNQWQLNYALGAWAAATQGRRAALMSSFYESGYDSLYAFQLGFEQAGGTVAHTEITHVPPRTDLQAAIGRVAASKPDVVYASYNGGEADEFLQAYRPTTLAQSIPLVTPGLGFRQEQLQSIPQAIAGFNWHSSLNNQANNAFVRHYQSTFKQSADAFAMLGFETASLLGAALHAQDTPRSAAFRNMLTQTSINGPRGQVTLDAATHVVRGPLYVQTLSQPLHQNFQPLQLPNSFSSAEAELQTALKTGWTHLYLGA